MRSAQQQQQTSEKSPSAMEGNSMREMNHPCATAGGASSIMTQRLSATPHPSIVLFIYGF